MLPIPNMPFSVNNLELLSHSAHTKTLLQPLLKNLEKSRVLFVDCRVKRLKNARNFLECIIISLRYFLSRSLTRPEPPHFLLCDWHERTVFRNRAPPGFRGKEGPFSSRKINFRIWWMFIFFRKATGLGGSFRFHRFFFLRRIRLQEGIGNIP